MEPSGGFQGGGALLSVHLGRVLVDRIASRRCLPKSSDVVVQVKLEGGSGSLGQAWGRVL